MIEGHNHMPESQIYHWGAKNASLDGERSGTKASALGVSSDAFLDNNIPQPAQGVKNGLALPAVPPQNAQQTAPAETVTEANPLPTAEEWANRNESDEKREMISADMLMAETEDAKAERLKNAKLKVTQAKEGSASGFDLPALNKVAFKNAGTILAQILKKLGITGRSYYNHPMQEDYLEDQMSIKEYVDPFTGQPVEKGK